MASKQSILISTLQNPDKYYTIEELVEKTSLKKTSVNNYLKYYLRQLGYTVELDKNHEGKLGYRISNEK